MLLSPTESYVIGRAESANISVMDNKVTREHCRISVDGGFYVVEDLGSKNGTWVNGKSMARSLLFHGDIIVVGDQQFRFELEADVSEESSGLGIEDVGAEVFATEIKERIEPDSASSLMHLSKTDLGEGEGADLERDLSAVCRIIDMVNAEEQLDSLFEVIMDHVMGVTTADRGYLFGGLEPGGVIIPRVSRHSAGTAENSRSCFSRTVVSECYETGYSILRADPLERETGISESIFRQHIQSVMSVPMRCQEGTVGVIYVDKLGSDKKFTKRDLRVLGAIGNQAGIAIRRAQLSRQVESLFSDTIRTLVNIIEVKDEYTHGHSERVTEVALRLGELAHLEKGAIRDLRLAGLIHDVGKIGVKTDVLKKPSELTESEYEEMKQHAAAGAHIISNIKNAERIADAVKHHHERWDGGGYPDSLAGEDIPLLARMLAIADAFDSMFAGRPYRDQLARSDVLTELEEGKGKQFDPKLCETFIQAFRSDPVFQSRINEVYAKTAPQGAKPASAAS